MGPVTILISASFILGSLICFGLIFDRHPRAATSELLRCIIFPITVGIVPVEVLNYTQTLFGCSFILWLCWHVNERIT